MKTLIVPNESNNWKYAARFVNLALSAGFKVEWALEPFRSSVNEESSSSAGSYIFPLESLHDRQREFLNSLAQSLNLRTELVCEALSCKKIFVASTRVCLFADAGSPYPFASVLSETGFDFDAITSAQIRSGGLDRFDVLIIPGGGDKGPPKQSESLGEAGRRRIRKFLMDGGGVWGSCAGCCNLILYSDEDKPPWAANYNDWKRTQSLKVINSEYWASGMSGVGRLIVSNLGRNHPLMFGMPKEFEVTWHLGPFLTTAPREQWIDEASEPTPLLQVKSFTDNWTAAEYLNSPRAQADRKSLERTYAGQGIRLRKYGLSVGYYGRGKVAACAGHPEFGLDPLLEKRGLSARIISNFLFWTASNRTRKVGRRKSGRVSNIHGAYHACFSSIRKSLNMIQKQTYALAQEFKSFPEPVWLQDRFAASTFGLSGRRKWPIILRRLSDLPSEIRKEADELRKIADELSLELNHWQERKTFKQLSRDRTVSIDSIHSAERLREQLRKMVECIEYSPRHDQDYGWQGILTLLSSASRRIRESVKNYLIDPTNNTTMKTPYELIWDYYLGALYDLINARSLLQARKALAADSLLLMRHNK